MIKFAQVLVKPSLTGKSVFHLRGRPYTDIAINYIMTGPKLELGGFPIPWIPSVPPEDETDMYPYRKQTPNTRKLPVGWQFAEGRRALNEELILDEVVAIPLRDGVKVRYSQEPAERITDLVGKIYCDIFRPVTDEKVPAILAVSPYGKNGHGTFTFDVEARKNVDDDIAARIPYFRQYSLSARTTRKRHLRPGEI